MEIKNRDGKVCVYTFIKNIKELYIYIYIYIFKNLFASYTYV